MDNNELEKNLEYNSEGSTEENNHLEGDNISESNIDVDSKTEVRNEEEKGSVKSVSFYSESYKKPNKPNKPKGIGLRQLIIVGLICSIVGGGVVGAIFMLVAPKSNSSDSFASDKTALSSTGLQGNKKIEIVKSDSPVTAIAEKVGPSIVGIKVTFSSDNLFMGSQDGVGEGSGIIVRSDGYIMTNNHVVSDAIDPTTGKLSSSSKIEVILPSDSKKSYPAQLVARDSKTDLAVLKVNLTGLPAAELGDSDSLKVGELAVAIGSPGGLDYMNSVTAGIISGLNRVVTENGVGLTFIQTDAPINSGNSGGALLNSKGQVIGINTLKAGTQDGYEGLGFAIPINKAKTVVDSLITNKYVTGRPPVLNLTANTDYTADVAKANKMPVGVYVDSVTEFGAAYKAGIRDGDVITKFDNQKISSFEQLTKLRDKHKVGDKVSVEIYRDGAYKTLTILLEEDKS